MISMKKDLPAVFVVLTLTRLLFLFSSIRDLVRQKQKAFCHVGTEERSRGAAA